MKRLPVAIALLMILLLVGSSYADSEARLLRFPDIHSDHIVFTYAGDLYTVSAGGGVARKLTNHDGFEMFARFSPDGTQLAFTGQYDGNTEVYLMPAEGGIPIRLTYTATLSRDDVSDRMGPNNIVMGWTHSGREILFRSRMREHNSFNGQLFTVSPDGGLSKQLPLPRGGFSSYSPDDKKLAYNRVFREFRTWKRYRGGMADDVWIYDFQTRQLENITKNEAQDIIPMWVGDKIYFLSDRDENKRMNLYVYDTKTAATKQVTNFTEFDIKFPSLGKEAIVFEYGGYIYRLDLATDKYAKVPIRIAEDMLGGRNGLWDVSKEITNYEISPDGNRALFGARGDVFTVPAKHGNTRNLTTTPGIHERNSKWSPDGKWIAYLSDVSEENELYILSQDGKGKPRRITTGADTYYYQMYWSPDSRKLLWADKKLRLRYVDVEKKTITEVASAIVGEFNYYTWSPDSKRITYARPEENDMWKVYIYTLSGGRTYEVTDDWYGSYEPVFSSDGQYLYFISNRDFNPIYSQTEWNHAYRDMAKIYLVPLTKKVESPFKPKSDEVVIDSKESKTEEEAKEDKKVVVQIDPEGLKDRIIALPIKASNYSHLTSVGDVVYYTRRGSADEKRQLLMYDFDEQEETELGEISGYEISADGKKMLVGKDRSYYIIDLPEAKLDLKDNLDLSGMEVMLDRRAEWRQIFNESWRQMRDFFYAPNMHGVDWAGVRKKHAPLVEHVNHRADLTYVIGEMVGELNVGHTYVGGGDYPKPERIATGLLGAELERDASGYYRIKRILKGENWNDSRRSPLTEVGVNASEGDFIVAVNGKSTDNMVNIFEHLVNTVGKQVTLTLNSRPRLKGGRDVVVRPIDDEHGLYYYNWVQANLAKVDKATSGKVGYIHIPDMGVPGLNEFVKHYYPQLTRKALIIDVRGNGGGNVSSMIIERLRREIAMIAIARNVAPSVEPGGTLWGPMIMIADEFSASDGDIVVYRFKKYGLGKVVGKRTWGGVVGIRGTLPLLDGGYLRRPEFSRYDVEGTEWIMEGYGVEPDIYVDNDPAKEYAGIDQQLNRAIEEILKDLETQEKTIPKPPPYPVK